MQRTRVNNILPPIPSIRFLTKLSACGFRRECRSPGTPSKGACYLTGTAKSLSRRRDLPRPRTKIVRRPAASATRCYSRSFMPSAAAPAVVTRVSRIGGRVRVPGDKSISHRYAMLAAIADGTSRLQGYAPGADCAATLACLEGYGVSVRRSSGPHGLNIENRRSRTARAPRTRPTARRRQLRHLHAAALRSGCRAPLSHGPLR